jgi:hypothetical protein
MRVVVSTGVMFRYSKPHPSRPSTDDSKHPLPSQIPLCGDAFSLLSLFCDISSRCLRNVWTCFLVLVLPFLWPLPFGARLPVIVAFAWTAKRDEAQFSKTPIRDAWKTTFHTCVHPEDISQKRENPDHHPPTEALCLCAATFIGNRIMDRTYGVWRSLACSRHSREYPLDRITLWEKRGGLESVLLLTGNER